MSKRKSNTVILKKEDMIKHLKTFLIAVLVVILFYPPYLQGLFFEKHVLPTQIIVFSTFIIFLVYKWLKNDGAFFRTAIEYVCLGFVIVYFISIFVAVHTRSAIVEWLKYCMYFSVFFMVSDLADNQKTKLLFLWTIIISALGVAIIGLDAALGGNIVRTLNRFFNILGVQGDLFFGLFVDNRIHSTLQYANALASFLMAVFFVTIGLLMFYNSWWQKILLGSITFFLFLAFMLTESRGAFLIFPIEIIMLLIIAPRGDKLRIITYNLLLVIPSIIVSVLISSYLSADTFFIGSIYLIIIGLLVTSVISILIEYIVNIIKNIKVKVYVIILLVIIVVIAIGMNYLNNQSTPIKLSLEDSKEDKLISISKDIVLKPNTEYILKFEAESSMKEEKPFAFFVRIANKNIKNILFDESEQLIKKNFSSTNGIEKFNVSFRTKEDTELININFSIYYSGTSVKLDKIQIVDSETGKYVKKIILKNKYNFGNNIISRFDNIFARKSVVSRIIFYKDGFNIFKDRWFLGAGGGAWKFLYRKYQSYSYTSTQAHNYPLQLAIETGIVGIFILINLVTVLVIYYVKYYKRVNNCNNFVLIFAAILGLLLHSIIDFDFSESSMILLFWTLIALFNRFIIDNLGEDKLRLIKININKNLKINNYVANKQKHNVSVIIGIAISIITLYFSSKFFIASLYAKKSFKFLQNGDIEVAINYIEKAINLDRYNEEYVIGYNPIESKPDVKAGMVDLLFIKNDIYNGEDDSKNNSKAVFQEQFSRALMYLKNIEKRADNNLVLTSNLAKFYFITGDIDKGIRYLNLAISYFPFEPSLWYAKVDVCYQLMIKYFNSKDYEKSKDYLLKGLNVINEAKEVNKKNLNPFTFNQETVELLEKMKFVLDNWGNEGIYKVDDIIHYSMFNLDININNIPDQWKISNEELLKITIENENMFIKVTDKAYIYTRYPIKFEEGSTYRIEIETNDNIGLCTFYISGITAEVPLNKIGNKYIAEFSVTKQTNEKGNELGISFVSDCVIKSILIKKIK